MIQASYAGSMQHDNAKVLLFKLAFSGNYGVNGVGDTLNLAPVQPGSNAGGVLDPNLSYDIILAEVPSIVGVFSENIGGYYVQFTPAAAPTLTNVGGIRVFAPNGTELATNAAYNAALLAANGGYVVIQVPVPLQ